MYILRLVLENVFHLFALTDVLHLFKVKICQCNKTKYSCSNAVCENKS